MSLTCASAVSRGSFIGQVREWPFHSRSSTGGSAFESFGTLRRNQAACSWAGRHQYMSELADASDAAGRLELKYRAFPTSAVEDIRRNLDTAGVEGFDTLIVDNIGLLQFHRWPIARQALERRMKAIGREREFAAIGGLASFGEESVNLYRRMAAHVDKILKGTRVAEIPVEQAAKFELVLNQKTAKALGLTIPPALLVRADEVIE